MFFVCSETVESNLVKFETSCTVFLPLSVSVPCTRALIVFKPNGEWQRRRPLDVLFSASTTRVPRVPGSRVAIYYRVWFI